MTSRDSMLVAMAHGQRHLAIFSVASRIARGDISAMQKLRTYLAEKGVTQRAFATDLGISQSHLNDIMTRRRTPSLMLALEIARVTDGAVPPESWAEEAET